MKVNRHLNQVLRTMPAARRVDLAIACQDAGGGFKPVIGRIMCLSRALQDDKPDANRWHPIRAIRRRAALRDAAIFRRHYTA